MHRLGNIYNIPVNFFLQKKGYEYYYYFLKVS